MRSMSAEKIIYPETFQMSSREAKGRKIIAAARSVFLSSGYDGASMDDIAMSAGVSKRTIYNRYASKEELFSVVARETCATFYDGNFSPCYKTPLNEFLTTVCENILHQQLNPQAISLTTILAFQVDNMPELGRVYLDNAITPWVENLGDYFEQQAELGRLAKPIVGEDAAWTLLSLITYRLQIRTVMGDQLSQSFEKSVSRHAKLGVEKFMTLYGV